MRNIEFYLPVRLVFEVGGLNRIGELTAGFGGKAAIVSDETMVELGFAKRLEESLRGAGIIPVGIHDVSPNPTSHQVDRAVAKLADEKVGFVIGLGGGSSIDFAKALAVALAYGEKIWNFIREPDKEPSTIGTATLPIVAVPTTAGTGAEVTPIGVLTNPDRKVKRGLYSEHIYPNLAVIDPDLMVTIPRSLTAATGIDALSHAIEAFISRDAHAYSEMTALDAIQRIGRHLPTACRNGSDIEARSQMAWGSTLAGIAMSNGDVTLVHAMAHPLGAHFNIGHGEAIAMCLPAVMRATWWSDVPKFGRIAQALGVETGGLDPKAAAEKSVEAVDKLLAEVGLNLRLKDFGVAETHLADLSRDVTGYMAGCLGCHPHVCSLDEVTGIFAEIL